MVVDKLWEHGGMVVSYERLEAMRARWNGGR